MRVDAQNELYFVAVRAKSAYVNNIESPSFHVNIRIICMNRMYKNKP
jgi:hypothetical protein